MLKSIDSFCLPGPAVLGQRIAVIGSTCSGKTTLAGQLASLLQVPHIELDALHWRSNWTPAPKNEFHHQIRDAVAQPEWISDGNYSQLRDIIWSRADTIIWLDYQLPLIMWRLLKRTFRRVVTRQLLWNGNVETLRGAVFSRDSLFVYAPSKFHRRRKTYNRLLQGADYADRTRIILPNPRTTKSFLGVVENIKLNAIP